MSAIHAKNLILILLLLLLVSCKKNSTEKQLLLLTNGSSKYWDEVFVTDSNGVYHNLFLRNSPYTCTKFEISGKATHYDYGNSMRIVDSNCTSDNYRNPDSFAFISDTVIQIQNHKYIIQHISKDFMVLKYGRNNKETITFVASKNQNKIIVKCDSTVGIRID
jgi:hypothetical protein